MAKKKLTKEVKSEIQKFVEDNQPQMDWNGAGFDRHTVGEILEKGWDDWLMELYDYNLEYVWSLEHDMISYVQTEWDEYDPDEVMEHVMEYISVDFNEKNLLCNLPDVTMLAYVYSNYDCCNSFDQIEPESYLGDVFDRVKEGVTKDDYLHEFQNGAYGGSLFCFAFRTTIQDAMELMEQIKTAKAITISKGTQFGFFSSFVGSGSVFEKITFKDMTIPIVGETEYDTVGLTADLCQSYSMTDVYGNSDFIENGTAIMIMD